MFGGVGDRVGADAGFGPDGGNERAGSCLPSLVSQPSYTPLIDVCARKKQANYSNECVAVVLNCE